MKWYQNQPLLFLVISISLILIMGLSLLVLRIGRDKSASSPVPTGTPNPSFSPMDRIVPPTSFPPGGGIYSEEYRQQAEEQVPETAEKLRRDGLVSKFIDTLPYEGAEMKVEYSITTNEITLFYQTGNKDAALAELDELLKGNGIEDRNWVYNLEVKPLLY